MQPGQDKAVRSREDIALAVRAMTPAEWVRLKKSATYWSNGRPIGATELLQEAFARAMDERQCPVDVGICKFLEQTMRSIASGEGDKVENRLRMVSADASEAMTQTVLAFRDPAPSAEQQMISDETVAAIRSAILALFDGDPAAQLIAEGMMDGNDGEELRAVCELDVTAYNTKRRLVRRRIDKAFPRGWQR